MMRTDFSNQDDTMLEFATTGQSMAKNFRERLLAGEKMDCPCCGRYAQAYHRTLHKGIVLSLIQLFKKSQMGEYLHISRFCTVAGGVDIPLARFWGLVEAMSNDDSKKRTSGMWRLTTAGAAFVRGELRIRKYAVLYDNALLSFDGAEISILDALAGGGFNYEDLMRN